MSFLWFNIRMVEIMVLIACYILRDQMTFWFPFSINSVLPIADKVLLVTDNPSEELLNFIASLKNDKIRIIKSHYKHESKDADGSQRQVYLDYLMKEHIGDWALVLDDDEVLSDNNEGMKSTDVLKSMMGYIGINVWSIRMRHCFFAFGMEDSSMEKHFVPLRMFKVKQGLSYPKVEHPVLQGFIPEEHRLIDMIHIWHFSGLQGIPFELLKWEKQCWKSNMHNTEELERWKRWHLFAEMPLKRYDLK